MADVNIIIDVAAKGAVKELNKLEKEFKDLGAQAEKTGDKSSKGFFAISKIAAGAAVAVAAVGTAAVAAINQASKFQDLETQFIAFTGSAESAADQVQRIAEFSGQTPFQVDELARANKTLLAFGSSTEESFVQLKQLGEVAAATGQNIGDLSQIFGQIQAAGRLTGERFNQLAERSVNLGPVLAESLGVAESEIRGLISAGKISSEEVAKAFATMTTGSGKFAGGMKRLSETFSGARSTLSDNIDLLAASLGGVLLPAAVSVVEELTNAVKVTNEFIKGLKGATQTDLDKRIEATKNELADLVDELADAKDSGKGFFESQEDFEQGLRNTENAIKDQLDLLKKLNSAKTIEEGDQASASILPGSDKGAGDEGSNQDAVANAQKISEEIASIVQQRVANEKLAGEAKNAALIEQLDVERDILLQKEEEKQIALLESQGYYEEAQLLKAQSQAEKLNEIKQKEEEQKLALIKKAKTDEFNFQKIQAKAELDFAQQTWIERAKTAQAGLGAIASLQYTGSKQLFEIGKAAAIAQTLISIPESAQKAYTSLAAFPPLAIAAAAAATIAGVARLNQIRSAKFTAYADGGEVTGGIPGVDSVPALLTPGEVVAPRKSFKDLEFGGDDAVNILTDIYEEIRETNALLYRIEGHSGDNVTATNRVSTAVNQINLPVTNDKGEGIDYTDISLAGYREFSRIRRIREGRTESSKGKRGEVGR